MEKRESREEDFQVTLLDVLTSYAESNVKEVMHIIL
jgi:hypothetical protein